MTSPIARYRYILPIVIALSSTACGPSADAARVRVVDLIREFDRAVERRPPDGYALADRAVGGVVHQSLAVPVPSRVAWAMPLPRCGVFRAFVALDEAALAVPVRLRFGVSDNRIYEQLADVTLTPERRGWIDLRADLSAYAGWKWSLFYRPDRMTWRVVLSADAIGGLPTTALWGAPEIVTDNDGAKEYATRRPAIR